MRPRREAPTTIWVALTEREKASTAAGMLSSTTVWKVPPRSPVSWRTSARARGVVPVVPSPRIT